jgi:hypothetical protein
MSDIFSLTSNIFSLLSNYKQEYYFSLMTSLPASRNAPVP